MRLTAPRNGNLYHRQSSNDKYICPGASTCRRGISLESISDGTVSPTSLRRDRILQISFVATLRRIIGASRRTNSAYTFMACSGSSAKLSRYVGPGHHIAHSSSPTKWSSNRDMAFAIPMPHSAPSLQSWGRSPRFRQERTGHQISQTCHCGLPGFE